MPAPLLDQPARILDCKVEDWTQLEGIVPDILDYCARGARPTSSGVQETPGGVGVEYVRNKPLARGLDYYVKPASSDPPNQA